MKETDFIECLKKSGENPLRYFNITMGVNYFTDRQQTDNLICEIGYLSSFLALTQGWNMKQVGTESLCSESFGPELFLDSGD